MKFTNKTFLATHAAEVLKAAWLNDAYDGPRGEKTLSVTQLISPPQKLSLEREHADEIEMDVLDTVPGLLGQALHHILERAGPAAPTHVPERRLAINYDGWIISGKADLYETKDHEIVDYKASSVWAYVFGKKEWDQQLNVYRWILEKSGYPVKKLSIVLFCNDWRRSEWKRSPDSYPQRVVVIPVEMWSMEDTTKFVEERLALHRQTPPPPCSPEDRWAKPTTYALMKNGRKTAVSVSETPITDVPPGHTVEVRPGISVRCESYCAARPFCKQAAADPTLTPVESVVTPV